MSAAPRWIRAAALLLACAGGADAGAATPETVYFPSADGRTALVGYLYVPATGGHHSAVVMLHGRGGPYSSNVNAGCSGVRQGVASPCGAATLSRRHMQWGEFWAERGYLALLVDSFGPRGKAHGFGRGTHDDPARDDVNERTVRPLDAKGGLAFLRARADVAADRVFLQGWSNGASTVLNVLESEPQAGAPDGFRAALAFYPGCGPRALLSQHYASATRLTAFLGSDDEEVSPAACREVLERGRSHGAPVEVVWYDGATHDFDDPGEKRQSVPANRAAREDAMRRAAAFFAAAEHK